MLKVLYYAICFSFAIVERAYGNNYVNYCNPKICGNTNSHTFCKYYVGPAVSCVGYIDAPLSKEEKVRILHRFNERRNYVASGNHRLFPPAANMLKMRWVEELARAAQRWADQCRPPASPEETDTCRDLFSVAVVQNVASLVGEAPGLRAESLVDMWYMQSLSYNGSPIRYETNNNEKPTIDFAQMVWSDSHLVGCGRSKFMVPINNQLRTVERLVCNIAPAGIESGTPFWLPGPPASRCPLRSERDEQYNNLCAYRTMDDNIYLSYMTCIHDTNDTICNPQRDTALMKAILFWESLNEIDNNPHLNYQGSLDDIYFNKVSSISLDDDGLNLKPDKTYEIGETTTLLMSSGKRKLIGKSKSYGMEELTKQDIDTMKQQFHGPDNKSSIEIRNNIPNQFDPRIEDHINQIDISEYMEVGTEEDVKEALNGMKNILESTQTSMLYSTKVRRELRSKGSIGEHVTEKRPYTRKSQLKHGIDATKQPGSAADKGFIKAFNNSAPLMKIMTKYLPLLKEYSSYLGGGANINNISTYLIAFMNCLILIN